MEIPCTTPSLKSKAFNCPHCKAYAKQTWSEHWHESEGKVQGLFTSHCSACDEYAIWEYSSLLYPASTSVEPASNDLPVDVAQDYNEAAQIMDKSPRSAAALLRLAVSKLCVYLGGTGKNLNNDIATLVENGLPLKVQQMLDTVRVVGNHSVHAGTLDINDNPETALSLFKLVNKISEKMITEPKELDEIYNNLPDKDIEQIQKRDNI